MEPKGSLTCSQVSDAGAYPVRLIQSIPLHPIPPKIHFNIIQIVIILLLLLFTTTCFNH
jgi:hypothetical protein